MYIVQYIEEHKQFEFAFLIIIESLIKGTASQGKNDILSYEGLH